jgi:glucose-1-phosphate adenylyltransferase
MAGGTGERLRPLTDQVPKPLLPFGGVFRILDFTLSNCRNSGVPVVGVISQYQSPQIGDHLRRLWDGAGGHQSFVHLPPAAGNRYAGTADAVRQNLDLVVDRRIRTVLILSADHIYQADYRNLVAYHRDSGADVTVAAARVPLSDAGNFGILNADETGTITGFEEKPLRPRPLPHDPSGALASMGVYVFSTDVLVNALCSTVRFGMDFGKDVLPNLIHRRRTLAWQFRSVGGTATSYWRDVGTFESYYQAHMDLLDNRDGSEPFCSRWPVAVADASVPGRMESLSRIRKLLRSSVIPEESRIEGRFERCVLSPGVWIGEGAEVRHSILMRDVHVGPGARVRGAIIGAGVHIPPGAHIGYNAQSDRSRFHVSESGLVVVDNPLVTSVRDHKAPQADRVCC